MVAWWTPTSPTWSSPTATTTTYPSLQLRIITSSSTTPVYTETTSSSRWYNDNTVTWRRLVTPTWEDEEWTRDQYRQALAAPAIVRRSSRHREHLQEQAAAYAEERERRLEAERAVRAAAERANDLLLAHLSPEQRATFDRNKWFVVEGGSSKRKYRIRHNGGSLVANIDVLDGDRVVHRLCAHIDPRVRTPHSDSLLAQKVMLELAEDEFLRLANRH